MIRNATVGPSRPARSEDLLAFAAPALGLPSIWTFVAFLGNVLLFVYMAVSEERAISQSPLRSAYAEYKQRIGQFVPHLWPRNPR